MPVHAKRSIALTFKLNLAAAGNVNNTVVNNLSRALKSHMRVLYGGETLQDTHRIDLFETYKDLYLSKRERENRLREGISSTNMRKLRTAAGDKVSTDANEVALAAVYGDRYRMPINHSILDAHGSFYAKALSQNLTFEITLPQSKEVTITSDTTKAYTYSLSNIELEYECIASDYLAREALSAAYQIGDVKKLPTKEVDKYFNRYQTVLGNKITQGLVSSALELAVVLASYAIPIDNNKELCEDLKANEVLTQELNNIAGYLLLKGGRMVALSSCLVQVAKHVNFTPPAAVVPAAEDQITKEPETPIVKQKDPKKVAAGKKLAEYHKNAKKALEKSEAPIVETTNNWTPSLTTTLTIVGIGLTALDLYFRWKKEAPIVATTPTTTPIPAVAPTVARRGME
ncbi:hypothetical protein QZH41_004659 [Actinostola sp. cb2023]|nr:hypothetical protein QZH41_004659 [Actinostola sp. cb2023]